MPGPCLSGKMGKRSADAVGHVRPGETRPQGGPENDRSREGGGRWSLISRSTTSGQERWVACQGHSGLIPSQVQRCVTWSKSHNLCGL